MKKIIMLIVVFIICSSATIKTNQTKLINTTLNNWHKAAAEANFENYFKVFTDDAIYIGTDATEYWNKKQFETYSKPYFDKGKAWSFEPLERHIYFSSDNETAWFDELLNTQMKICRGSGVMIKEGKLWKIKHYVLSMTIPNENTAEIVKIKSVIENQTIEKLKTIK